MMQLTNKKLIIAITGASGAIYGIRMLEILRSLNVETHLIISTSANITIKNETSFSIKDVYKLSTYAHNNANIAANIASGSYKTDGMIIAPCSMKTIASIASGYENNLITRAAMVCIKEQRRIALMARETPLSPIHLQNMLTLSKCNNVAITPAMPAFYIQPQTLDDIVNHSIARILDLFDLDTGLIKRWGGIQ